MTMRRSAVRAISAIRWLETKTVLPSAASDFIRFLIQRIPSGSRPLTGSSRRGTGGGAGGAGRGAGGGGGGRGRGGEPLGRAQGELARLAVGRPVLASTVEADDVEG